MLILASPTDPRAPPSQAPHGHHRSWALGGPPTTAASALLVHGAHLLPLLQGQVGRAQNAHTFEDPFQYWVSEVLPDWVVQLLGLLAPDLRKLLVEQGSFLLWVPGRQGSLCRGEVMVLREGRKAKGSWKLGLPRGLFPPSEPSGAGTRRICLRGAVEQRLGP